MKKVGWFFILLGLLVITSSYTMDMKDTSELPAFLIQVNNFLKPLVRYSESFTFYGLFSCFIGGTILFRERTTTL